MLRHDPGMTTLWRLRRRQPPALPPAVQTQTAIQKARTTWNLRNKFGYEVIQT
jgi:hypothetical protein